MSTYRVVVLFEGYSNPVFGGQTANCSCTLITGKKNIIVDTMTSWDGEKLICELKKHGVSPDSIDYVVSTHGHSDHTGNNNLFLSAKHIVGWSISYKDRYFDHPFERGVPYRIDECISVMPTPGHTMSDVSVVIRNAEHLGTVVVAGDLFENENDLLDDRVWKAAGSESEELQKQNRSRVLEIADYIVPGHGKMFKVKK